MNDSMKTPDLQRTLPFRRSFGVALCALLLSACAVGPDYQTPDMPTPAHFKQAEGWTQANPSDAIARGAWWEIYLSLIHI